MNIVYVVDQWPKLSQSFILREVIGLAERGHKVAVWACSVDPNPDITHEGFDSLDVPVGSPSGSRLSPDGIVQLLRNSNARRTLRNHLEFLKLPVRAGRAIPWIGHLLRFLEELPWSPDIIHTHFLTDWAWAAVYAADVIEAKASGTAHAFDIYKENLLRQLKPLSRNLDLIVTISEAHREHIINQIGPEPPVKIIHCGVDPSQFAPTEGSVPNRIVTVARDQPKKGLRFGIEALSRIDGAFPGLEWRIIGPEETSLERIAEQYDVSEYVSVLGRVDDQRLISELDVATLTLLPCVIEEDGNRDGIPVALMEAMAMETVPISSPVAGIPELITDRKNGYLSPVLAEGDGVSLSRADNPTVSDKLVTTMEEALTTPQADRGRQARKTIERSFNIDIEVKKLEKTFDELIGE